MALNLSSIFKAYPLSFNIKKPLQRDVAGATFLGCTLLMVGDKKSLAVNFLYTPKKARISL